MAVVVVLDVMSSLHQTPMTSVVSFARHAFPLDHLETTSLIFFLPELKNLISNFAQPSLEHFLKQNIFISVEELNFKSWPVEPGVEPGGRFRIQKLQG